MPEENTKDLLEYYEKLRTELKNSDYTENTYLGIKIKEKLNILIKMILRKIIKYDVYIEGAENIPSTSVIYASSHQEFNDIINSIYANKTHTLTLNASNIRPHLKLLLNINGVIFVDRDSKESRNNAKVEMERALLKGKSVNLYPEATWNCTPSKLHLPFYKGMIEIAQVTNKPLIPVVQEYIYDENQKITAVFIKFCEPVYVDITDDIYEKLAEFSEKFSTARWELIEEKGLYLRKNISNKMYTDYIKARIKEWQIPGNDIKEERKQVLGSQADIYDFIPVNDVEFDDNDVLLSTSHVRVLEKINKKHLL